MRKVGLGVHKANYKQRKKIRQNAKDSRLARLSKYEFHEQFSKLHFFLHIRTSIHDYDVLFNMNNFSAQLTLSLPRFEMNRKAISIFRCECLLQYQ